MTSSTRTEVRRAIVREIATALRSQPKAVLRLTGWFTVAAFPTAISGWTLARSLDDGFLAGDLVLGCLWAAPLVLATIAAAVANGRSSPSLGAIVEPFRDRLVERVVTSALAEAAASPKPTPPGAALARLGPQIDAAYAAFSGAVSWALGLVLTTLLVAAGQAFLSVEALLLVLPPMIVCVVVYLAMLPEICRRQRAVIASATTLTEATTVLFDGLRDIRAAGAASWAERETLRQISVQQRAGLRVVNANASRALLLALTSTVATCSFLLAAPALVRGGLQPGEFVGTMTYMTGAVIGILALFVNGMNGSAIPLWLTLEKVLSETEHRMPADTKPSEPARSPTATGIELRDVAFAYGQHSAPVLRDLNLDIPAGEHLVVVGASGIGKSTLVNLLAGVLEPSLGRVRLSGTEPALLTPGQRAGLRVLIPQEAYVFTDTLGANLRYLRPDADVPLLDLACSAIGLEGLRDRVGGYDVAVAPSLLSAAERQLIALTRSWLSPAPIALLDEATSALDAAAEQRVERAFAHRPGTLVVVAHRISSARRADRILVLDGSEPHLGTHEQLLVSCAMYRDLVGHWTRGGDSPNRAPGLVSTDAYSLIN